MAIDLKPEEVSAILRQQLAEFDMEGERYDIGSVLSVGDGIARVHGLSNVMAGELVEFQNGLAGMALNLEEENVGIAIFGSDTSVREGDQVKRTGKIASVPAGDHIIGRIVDALGNAIDGGAPIARDTLRNIELKAPGIIDRQDVKEPLQTGIKVIDALTPVGRSARNVPRWCKCTKFSNATARWNTPPSSPPPRQTPPRCSLSLRTQARPWPSISAITVGMR